MDPDRIAIAYVQSAADAREALASGYEPVECSFGDDSVIGPLQMDHHGAYSHLPGVAIRAHGDLFGSRAQDPRFVVTMNGLCMVEAIPRDDDLFTVDEFYDVIPDGQKANLIDGVIFVASPASPFALPRAVPLSLTSPSSRPGAWPR